MARGLTTEGGLVAEEHEWRVDAVEQRSVLVKRGRRLGLMLVHEGKDGGAAAAKQRQASFTPVCGAWMCVLCVCGVAVRIANKSK